MSKNTREQHYIPKLYLKNFANQDKTFTIINIEKKHPIKNIPYLSQFKEKYFYDKDNLIENKLNLLETNWAKVINNIIIGRYPSQSDKNILKEFAIYQRNRTLFKSKELLEISWQSKKVKLEIQSNIKNINISESKWDELKSMYLNNCTNNHIVTALEIAEKNLNILDDLSVAIIKYNTKNKLISSDNPIVHYNNFDQKSVGYINAGLIVFFPLNSELLCVIYDNKMYKSLDEDKFIYCSNEYEVKYLNYFQILNAYNYVYFRDSNQANSILKLINKQQIQLRLKLPKTKTDVLGPKYEKVLSFSAKYVYLEHTFSFSRLISRAKMVPKNVRNWFPRKFDEEYYKGNFKSRIAIVPVLNFFKTNKEFKKAILWNEKEALIFNQFIEDYWNNSL